MIIKEKLESLLRKHEDLTENEKETLSMFKSCTYWLSENPETETNLYPLDLRFLGNNAKIYEHIGSLRFSISTDWKSVFNDWISWLRDLSPEWGDTKPKIKQLERAIENPKALEENPYYFLMNSRREESLISLNFLENQFVIRYFAHITPTLPLKLIVYNIENTKETCEKGGIINLNKLETPFLNELQELPKFITDKQEPLDFEPLTRKDILELAEKYSINYQNLLSQEKVKWILIHDSLYPSEKILIPEGLGAEIEELGLRTQQNPNFISDEITIYKKYTLTQNQISSDEVKKFLQNLYEKTKIQKLEAMIALSTEIGMIVNNRFSNGIGFREGGLETQYIYAEFPREKTLEYFGDLLSQTVRASMFPKDRKITRAFFGWIGRHLMKEFFPETDFSYDGHLKIDKEMKKEYDGRFKEVIKATEKGMEVELTIEKVKEWFKSFDLFGEYNIPGISLIESCNFPFEIFLDSIQLDLGSSGEIVRDIVGFGNEKEPFDFRYFKEQVLGHLQGKCDGSFYLKQAIKTGFKQEDINEGNILKVYFETRRRQLREAIKWERKQAYTFYTSYFRFIKDSPYRAGYYYAQKHIDKENIMPNLKEVFQTPEKELMKNFIRGKIKIYDNRDKFPDWDSGLDREREMHEFMAKRGYLK